MKKIISVLLATVFLFAFAASPVSAAAANGPVSVCAGTFSKEAFGDGPVEADYDFKDLPEFESTSGSPETPVAFGRQYPYDEYVNVSYSQYVTLGKLVDQAYSRHDTTLYLYDYKIPFKSYTEYTDKDDSYDLLYEFTYYNPKCFDIKGLTIWYRGSYIDKVVFEYNLSLSTYKSRLAECDKIANEMIADLVNADITPDVKALIVHDRLALWNEYDHENLNVNRYWYSDWETMYGAFVKKTSVCQGYAMAYSYMLDKLGIKNYLCPSDDLDHVWNILEYNFVGLGECRFHVDVTWDDIDDTKGGVKHDYFLKSTAAFNHDAYDYDRTPSETYYDEGFFWSYSNTAMQYVNGDLWFITDDEREKHGEKLLYYDLDAEKLWWVLDLTEESGFTWPHHWGGTYIYYENFCKLDTDGIYLYFNSADKIYKYDIKNYSYDVLYDFDFGNNAIRGFEIKGNTLTVSVFDKAGNFVRHYTYSYSGLPMASTFMQVDGTWYLIKNGKVDASATTLVKYNGHWFYVKNGILNRENTLVQYNGTWYQVKNGKLAYDTGLVKYGNDWFYVKGGKLNRVTTLVKHTDGKWYYIKNGKWTKETTLVSYNGTWYYVNAGRVDFNANTLVQYNGQWFHVKGGKWVKDTALVKYGNAWFYVKGGKLCRDNTLIKHTDGKWYHVNGGKWVKDTTLVLYNGTYYYVNAGRVNFTANTLVKYGGKWYHVKGGTWVKDTAIVSYSGNRYYVKGGVMQSSFSGRVRIGGVTYYISGGKVV